MANHVGTKVSRLIRERAYLAGSLPSLESRKTGLERDLAAATEAFEAAQKRLEAIDASITELSAITPSDIRPVRHTPHKLDAGYGDFRREMIRVLKETGGPVETAELFRHMAATFSMPNTTSAEKRKVRGLVRRPLYEFEKKGAVRRLPSVSDKGHGVWEWVDRSKGGAQ